MVARRRDLESHDRPSGAAVRDAALKGIRTPRRGGGLPDRIRPGVRVLFVGINPGLRSAALGHHFAGPSNRFWKLLYESRLVPVPLTCHEDVRLPEWGYGLTNIVARPSRGIDALGARDYASGRRRLIDTIERFRPRIVAVLGVSIVHVLRPDRGRGARARRERRRLGVQRGGLAGAKLVVLPNPSGRNAAYSYRDMLAAFRGLRRLIRSTSTPAAP